jgi:hypothetical protein
LQYPFFLPVPHPSLVRLFLRLIPLVLLTSAWAPSVDAQSVVPPGDRPPPNERRVHWNIAAGSALEVAIAGDRDGERGALVAPAVDVRLASWFEYVIEGHVSRYFAPTGGTVAGVVPIGWRLHGRGQTQPYVSMGAGIVWADFTDLRGIERRRNYLTQVGAGVRRVTAGGAAVSVEARLFHLSNLSSAPPNLGIEVFTVLVAYRPGAGLNRAARR